MKDKIPPTEFAIRNWIDECGNIRVDGVFSKDRYDKFMLSHELHDEIVQALKDLSEWVTRNTSNTPIELINARLVINKATSSKK